MLHLVPLIQLFSHEPALSEPPTRQRQGSYEVTLMLPPDVAALEALGTRAGVVFADLMRFFAIHHRERYGWDGPPIHDAVAVAWLLEPSLVSGERLRVDIDTSDGPSRGRTIADPEGLTGRPANVEVGLSIDRERLMAMLVEAIARLEPRA